MVDLSQIVGRIVQLKDDGLTWEQIRKQVCEETGEPFTSEALRGRYRARDKTPKETSPAIPISLSDKTVEEITAEDFINDFKRSQSFRKTFSIRELQIERHIPSETPIAVTFFSDQHLGSPYTDYDACWEDTRKIRDNDNLYCVKGGDATDKFMAQFKDKSAVVNQLSPAQQQLLAEEKMVEYIEDKIIAKIGGNHDRMDEKQTGISTEYFIYRGKKFPYMPHGGLIKLTIGDIEYKILIKHHYGFTSRLNQFNSHHRMLEMLAPDCDIVVQEHEHNPGIESIEKFEFDQKRTVINIRTGSYKIDDPYSMDYFKAGRIAPQTVILWPDRRKILAMHGKNAIDDALIYLKGWEQTNGSKKKTKKKAD